MTRFIPWNSRSLDDWRQRYAPGHIISLNGRSTHYLERGEGEPIILIHGFNMDMNTWLYNIHALAEHFKVYALDLWGLGYSTREPLDYGYDLYSEQLRLFMEAKDIEQATLIGHSMGGGTAVIFTLRHPEKVKELVLVDTTGFPNPLPLRSKLFTLPGVGEFLLGINNDFLRKKNLREIWLHNGERLTPDAFATVSQYQKVEGTSEILLEILRKDFFHTLDAEIRRLGEMGVPTLIVWGKHDASIPYQIGEEIHREIKGSQFAVIEDGGHMPNFDCPDEFNRLVLDFCLTGAGRRREGVTNGQMTPIA